MTSMRMAIDIEALLVWAYRDQQVDRRVSARPFAATGGGGSNWPGQTLALGARVDVSGAGAAMAACALAQARTADDALIVHDAVLALGDVWIEARGEDVVLWTPEAAGADGFAIIEASGAASLRPATPNGRVADHVVAPLARAIVAPLLIQHARSATRPDWAPGWDAEAAQAWGEAGRDRWGRRRARPRAAARAEAVARDRGVYLVWRAALVALAVEMEGALSKWEAVGPSAPESPWEMRGGRGGTGLVVQAVEGGKPLATLEDFAI